MTDDSKSNTKIDGSYHNPLFNRSDSDSDIDTLNLIARDVSQFLDRETMTIDEQQQAIRDLLDPSLLEIGREYFDRGLLDGVCQIKHEEVARQLRLGIIK